MRKFKENYACKLLEFTLNSMRIQPANSSNSAYKLFSANIQKVNIYFNCFSCISAKNFVTLQNQTYKNMNTIKNTLSLSFTIDVMDIVSVYLLTKNHKHSL